MHLILFSYYYSLALLLLLLLHGNDETPDIEDLRSFLPCQFYSNITSPHYQFILTVICDMHKDVLAKYVVTNLG